MSTANPIADYESELKKLENIVSAMESGELSLEAALTQYEQGIALIRQCQEALNRAEQKIQLLSHDANTQEETLIPFDEASQ